MTRTEFLQRRKSGIGSSDVAAVLGISPWVTPYQLYCEKTSPVIDVEESEILHFGHIMESVIASEYMRRHGVKLQKRNRMYRSRKYPELIADIDRYEVGGRIVELKNVSEWAGKSKFGDGKDDVPDYYLLQCQHQMFVTEIHELSLAAVIGGHRYRDYEIQYDAELAEFAAAKCHEYYTECVEKRNPPPATAKDVLSDYYMAKAGAQIVATPEVTEIIARYKELKAAQKTLDELTSAIKIFAGENEIIIDPAGGVLATWKQGKDKTTSTVDYAALCAAHGIGQDEIDKYTTITTKRGTRPLLVK